MKQLPIPSGCSARKISKRFFPVLASQENELVVAGLVFGAAVVLFLVAQSYGVASSRL